MTWLAGGAPWWGTRDVRVVGSVRAVAGWKRGAQAAAITLAAGVPDAVTVLNGADGLLGWDESPCCAYLAAHGMPCGDQ